MMNPRKLNIAHVMLLILILALVLWFFLVVRPWWIEGQGMHLSG
jgi:hypothetical protein